MASTNPPLSPTASGQESFELRKLLLFEKMYHSSSSTTQETDTPSSEPAVATSPTPEHKNATGDRCGFSQSERPYLHELPKAVQTSQTVAPPEPSPRRESAISILLDDLPSPSSRTSMNNLHTPSPSKTGSLGQVRRARPLSSYGGSHITPSKTAMKGGGNSRPLVKDLKTISLKIWLDDGVILQFDVPPGMTKQQLCRDLVQKHFEWLGFPQLADSLSLFWTSPSETKEWPSNPGECHALPDPQCI